MMRYVLAVFVPPLAVLLCGRFFGAILNLGLTFLGWLPGVIHALAVVSGYEADRRAERIIAATRQGGAVAFHPDP